MVPPPPGLLPGARRRRGRIASAADLCRAATVHVTYSPRDRTLLPVIGGARTDLERGAPASVLPRMRALVMVFWCLLLLAGCGGGSSPSAPSAESPSPRERAEQGQPVLGQKGDEEPAGPALGFPVFATKNTTRVGGADPVADAAGVAQAVFPSRSEDTRPPAVVLVDQDDWRAGIAAAQLTAAPVRAPVLLTEGSDLPKATADALEKLRPTGSKEAGGAQVIRVGDVAKPDGLKSTDLPAGNPAATARAIDR